MSSEILKSKMDVCDLEYEPLEENIYVALVVNQGFKRIQKSYKILGFF